jgi:hypothetical protein
VAKFDLLDLTVAQVEAIEVLSEVGFDQWNSPKASKAALYGAILVEIGGVPKAEVAGMKLRDLVERTKELLDMGDGEA